MNYLLLSNIYDNNQTLLEYICLKHKDKEVQTTTWNRIQQNQGCKYCGFEKISKNKTTPYEDIKKELLSYNLILITKKDEYINAEHKLKVRNFDGYYLSIKFRSLRHFKPNVFDKSNPYTIENIKIWLIKNNIDLILKSNNFIGASKKLIWICKKHGEFKSSWNSMSSSGYLSEGKGCPECAKEYKSQLFRKPISEVKKQINIKGNGEYELLEHNYLNAYTPINIKHLKCGHIYPITMTSFLRGSRCPKCNESKGENIIRCFCENNNIFFSTQYKFPNLVSDLGNCLRFDFAIFEDINKSKLKLLIEYDGIFHYKKVYDQDGFELIQYHDKLKNQYCKNNKIPLLRIPYWEFDNVENILTYYLLKGGENNEKLYY